MLQLTYTIPALSQVCCMVTDIKLIILSSLLSFVLMRSWHLIFQ